MVFKLNYTTGAVRIKITTMDSLCEIHTAVLGSIVGFQGILLFRAKIITSKRE